MKRQKIKRGASQTYDTPSFHEYEINGCNQALSGDTVRREYFVSGTQPTENCDCHVKYRVCKKSGKLATEKCPKSQVEERVYLIKEEQGTTKDTPYVLTPKLRSPISPEENICCSDSSNRRQEAT